MVKLPVELLLLIAFSYGTATGLVISAALRPLFQVPEKKKKPAKKAVSNAGPKPRMNSRISVKNAAVNAVTDQVIETAAIEIPVIAETVLEYGPNEINGYPNGVKIFYPAAAISDPEYLETIRRSPLQTETHEKNTSEYNRDIDGWPSEVWYDETEKRAKLKGYVKGKANVQYVTANKNKAAFGTSAYINFLQLDDIAGIAPNGQPYDAIVRKMVNDHIAILPNPRDPSNRVVAMNSAQVVKNAPETEAENADKIPIGGFEKSLKGKSDAEIEKMKREAEKSGPWHKDKDYDAKRKELGLNQEESQSNGATNMDDYEKFKGHMNAYMEEEKAKEEAKNKIKNEIVEELTKEKSDQTSGEIKNEDKKEETEEKVEEKKEASNALPSQEMIKDFSDNLGVVFPQTPSFETLGLYAGITEKEPAKLVSALNAMRAGFKKTATNSNQEGAGSVSTVEDALRQM